MSDQRRRADTARTILEGIGIGSGLALFIIVMLELVRAILK